MCQSVYGILKEFGYSIVTKYQKRKTMFTLLFLKYLFKNFYLFLAWTKAAIVHLKSGLFGLEFFTLEENE